MKKMLAVVLVALLAILWSGAALAQSGDATEGNPEPSAYLTLDLQAGFVLDPFIVSLNGGGEVDASTLDPACMGFINDKPVLQVNWEGEAEFVDVFFYSDTDPTLVIQLPDGSYLCNDDVNDNLLDPKVTLETPEAGNYKVWVGSYDENQLVPGLLIITADRDYTLTNFDPGRLVRREKIAGEEMRPVSPESVAARAVLTSTAQIPVTQTASSQAQTQKLAGDEIPVDAVIAAGSTPVTATLVTTGTVPAFLIGSEDVVCGGLVEGFPDYILEVQDETDYLRIFFEADQDASLAVVTAEGGTWCSDDAEAGANQNPLVDIPLPAPGYYGVFVGRFDEEVPVTGTLSIATGPELEPEILAPEATP